MLLCWLPEEDNDRPGSVSIFFGFFLMVNFVLGTGFLGIPFGFYQSGVLTATCTLLCTTLTSGACAVFVLETMARCQVLLNFTENEVDWNLNNRNIDLNFRVTSTRKFEPSEQCEILGQLCGSKYCGKLLKIVYLLLLSAITFFACIAYCTVAGPAWAVNLPLHFGALEQCESSDFSSRIIPEGGCQWSYRFCVFLFACIVVPLTLLDLKEQAIVQFLLSIMRFATVGAIILYCLVHIGMGGLLIDCDVMSTQSNVSSNLSLQLNSVPETDLTNSTESLEQLVVGFSLHGWLPSVPVFVAALVLHQGIPALTHPIKEKHHLLACITLLFFVLGSVYMGLGLVVSLWFRDCTQEMCTLNWGPYTQTQHSMALRILSYIIILFPSFDVCSAFPLVVHTTVNNLYTVIFGRDTSQDKGLKWMLIQRGMKLAAAVLPICIAMFISNLVVILNYAGLIGFFAGFLFPVFLHLRSQWVCTQTFKHMINSSCSNISYNSVENENSPLLLGSHNTSTSFSAELMKFFFTIKSSILYKTPFSMFISHPLFAVIISLISFFCFILNIVNLIMPS